MRKSATAEGMGRVFHNPALGFAELAWRWTFAVAAWLLLGSLLLEYLHSLPVTRADLFLLRSGLPRLVLATLSHILMSGAGRLVGAILVLLIALSALWIFAASVGRAATVGALLNNLEEASLPEAATGLHPPVLDESQGVHRATPLPWRSLLGLHFWRAGLLFAALIAVLGVAMLSGLASPESDSLPGLAFLFFIALTCIIAVAWKFLDWLLSMAPIFAIAEGQNTFDAFAGAAHFLWERPGPVVGTTTLFAVIHLTIFFLASSVVFVPLMFLGIFPGWLMVAAVAMLTLVYFAVVDFLYVARLAAYISILSAPAEGSQSSPVDVQPEPPTSQIQAPLDDDDILSDIPGLVPPPEPA